MINLAGNEECDLYIKEELRTAGISAIKGAKSTGEVPSKITGSICGWTLHRAWYYWVANGPALPFKYSVPLNEIAGEVIRVAGYAGGMDPIKWYGEPAKKSAYADIEKNKDLLIKLGRNMDEIKAEIEERYCKGVMNYHIDTQTGLNLFAAVLRKWEDDQEAAFDRYKKCIVGIRHCKTPDYFKHTSQADKDKMIHDMIEQQKELFIIMSKEQQDEVRALEEGEKKCA